MTEINIRPMPRSYLKIPMRLRPCIPPFYLDIPPEGVSREDRELAYELFQALDPESKAWYRYNRPSLFADLEKSEKGKSSSISQREERKEGPRRRSRSHSKTMMNETKGGEG
ncbi:MAG: hypothetical protein C4576_19715 [Desulfobacteraceae bacterium]|nr:MAG: hypothetical protein C4576_19715 [Desulfobacteraceae bacterium]